MWCILNHGTPGYHTTRKNGNSTHALCEAFGQLSFDTLASEKVAVTDERLPSFLARLEAEEKQQPAGKTQSPQAPLQGRNNTLNADKTCDQQNRAHAPIKEESEQTPTTQLQETTLVQASLEDQKDVLPKRDKLT